MTAQRSFFNKKAPRGAFLVFGKINLI